jgi:hypothetical protein
MNHHEIDRLSIMISIEVPDAFIESYPWIIGPFPEETDILDLVALGDGIVDALLSRYPVGTAIDLDVVSLTPSSTAFDAERLADLITNEHRAIDPDLADIFDDLYVREILDSITTDEVER